MSLALLSSSSRYLNLVLPEPFDRIDVTGYFVFAFLLLSIIVRLFSGGDSGNDFFKFLFLYIFTIF